MRSPLKNMKRVSSPIGKVTRDIAGAVAPVVSSFIGTGTSYTLDVSLAGTLYIVANSSATLLSPATVKSNAVGLTGGSGYYNGAVIAGANGFTLTGTFTAGNTYYLHAVAESAGVLSAVDVVGTPYVEPAAALAIRASTSIAANNIPSQTINVPTGTVNGDRLVLLLATNGNLTNGIPSPQPPTGWVQISDANVAPAGSSTLWAYERTAASEPASYTIALSGFNHWSLAMVTFMNSTGKGNFSFKFVSTGLSSATNSVVATVNSLILSVCAFDADTLTSPASTTAVQGVTATAAAGVGIRVVVEGPVAAGATTARTFTDNVTATTYHVLALEMKA